MESYLIDFKETMNCHLSSMDFLKPSKLNKTQTILLIATIYIIAFILASF